MRNWTLLLALLALISIGVAQDSDDAKKGGEAEKAEGEKSDGDKDADEGAGDKDDGKAEEPKAAPLWKMSDKDRTKFGKVLNAYLNPGKKLRSQASGKVEKFVAKAIDGHSPLEDVAGIIELARQSHVFNKRLKKGKIQEVKIEPDVHGFPGGIGTVRYTLYLPTKYNTKTRWPVILCLPNNRKWPDRTDYLKKAWLRNAEIKSDYILAVPAPQSKGDGWTRSKSWARAMITLRHLFGVYGTDAKSAGPATDTSRIFVAGGDAAALVAASFPEMIGGAILNNSDGRATPGPNLREGGGLHDVPAFAIYQAKNRNQKNFANDLATADDRCVAVEASDDKGLGDDKAILAWMKKIGSKNPQPNSIEYNVYDGSFQRHYWINVLGYDGSVKPAPSFRATADRATNELRVVVKGITRFELFLSDALVDLNKPVKVIVVEGEKEYPFFRTKSGAEVITRDIGRLLDELVSSNHPGRAYTNMLIVDVPSLRAAAEAAAEKAKEADGKAPKKETAEPGTE